MLHHLVEAIPTRPATVIRRASEDFGPPPAAVHAVALGQYTDAQVLDVWCPDLLAALRDQPDGGAQ